jgi:allophanate hydrolase
VSVGQSAAWISMVPQEEAQARAEVASGPLAGMPFAVKDNIDVAGMPTTAGCSAYAYTPDTTAPAVQRLLDAGAVLVGKTNLDQFATGLVGTRSPYGICHSVLDPTLISGGSSSGSAVAVASGEVDFGLGTDTAGSGRVPAAANGIVGLKPTRGLVSTGGVVPACRIFDCLSVFSRTVAMAARVLDVLAPDGLLPAERRRWRLGVPSATGAVGFEDTLPAVAEHGDICQFDPSPLFAAGELLYGGALVAERLTTIGPLLREDPDALHPVVREVVERGLAFSAEQAFADLHQLDDLRARMAPVWDEVDALVCPTVPDIPTIAAVQADPIGMNAALGRWTQGVNLLDLCAVTIPLGVRPDGLPGSVSVIGPANSDARIATIASALLGEEPWAATRSASDRVELAVVGAHLRGLPLHHQLTDLGAVFVEATRTAPVYRLHALPTDPPKPGMVRVTDGGGSVEAEIYSLDAAAFGRFVAAIPPPLTIGTVELADGRTVKGFLCEPAALHGPGTEDITDLGSWRRYVTP